MYKSDSEFDVAYLKAMSALHILSAIDNPVGDRDPAQADNIAEIRQHHEQILKDFMVKYPDGPIQYVD